MPALIIGNDRLAGCTLEHWPKTVNNNVAASHIDLETGQIRPMQAKSTPM